MNMYPVSTENAKTVTTIEIRPYNAEAKKHCKDGTGLSSI